MGLQSHSIKLEMKFRIKIDIPKAIAVTYGSIAVADASPLECGLSHTFMDFFSGLRVVRFAPYFEASGLDNTIVTAIYYGTILVFTPPQLRSRQHYWIATSCVLICMDV